MEIVVIIVSVLCGLAWLYAVVNWGLAVSHRREDLSGMSFVFNGILSFDPDNFTERGKVFQKRFMVGGFTFFIFVFFGVGLVVISSPP